MSPQKVSLESVRTLNRLIPDYAGETTTSRSDRLALAVLQKFLGGAWVREHVEKPGGFLSLTMPSASEMETGRMRRIMLAEMLYNLQRVRGFETCLAELAKSEVEAAYAAMDVGRLITNMCVDRGLTFRFVPPSGRLRRDYDLSLTFSDGVSVRAETKCKLEETRPTLRTLESSLSRAKSQLPPSAPGIIFVKIPSTWLENVDFVIQMDGLTHRFLDRSRSIVSVKFYVQEIVRGVGPLGEHFGEKMMVLELTNGTHRFKKLRSRGWDMFPADQPNAPEPIADFNGFPATWTRFIVRNSQDI